MGLLRRLTVLSFTITLLLGLAGIEHAVGQESETGSGLQSLSSEQATALSDLLKDDAVRDALVGELERITEAGAPTEQDARPEQVEAPVSFSRQVAHATQDAAESLAESAMSFWGHLSQAPRTIGDAMNVSPDIVLGAVRDLALIVFATVLIFLILRTAAKRLYRSMGSAVQDAGPLQTTFITVLSIIIDGILVATAWGAGYALELLAFGSMGEIGIRQTLYLNAFLIVEMVKVVLRGIFSPSTPHLRPVNIPDRGARVLTRWLSIIVSLLGYGQLLIVPILNQNVSFATGRGVSTLIAVAAILMLIWLVLAYRRSVADWLLGDAHMDEKRGPLRFLARKWHVAGLIYLFGVLAIVLARPGDVLFPVLGASGKIAAAVIVGLIVANVLGRAISRGVQVPERVSQRLPLLERRLNAFVPSALTVLRLAIFAVVAFFTADTIGMIDVQLWLESRIGVQLTGTALSVVFVLVFSFALWLAVSSWIDFRLNPEFGSVPTAREPTLLSLLRNVVTIALMVITLMFVLSEIGIDIAPLIASAGVLGLAIGFGAQKLVQDIITGVFIQLENAMNVGDVVTLGGTTGTIERLTIRSVSLRDVHGVFHIIPFSSVDMVSNYMRDYGNFVCDMGIAYREDIGDAKQAMHDGFDELRQDPAWASAIIGDLQWFGLQAFGDSAVVVRARIKCEPGQQWGVGRAYNEILKRIFDERGIEIPFPHQTIYFGEDKSGSAPALPIRMVTQTGSGGPD